MSKYWFEKIEMEEKVKKSIKKYVKGQAVGDFRIGDTCHQLYKVDGNVFKKVFRINREFLYKGNYTAPPNENDYDFSENYLSDDGLAGFSISSTGWLTSLYSNYAESGFAKAVKPYVVKDAYKLVCIVANSDENNPLVQLYEKVYGFREYASTINDEQIMRKYYGDEFMDSFVENYGMPYHIFMIGSQATGTDTTKPRFSDYFEAEAYVEQTVTREEEE